LVVERENKKEKNLLVAVVCFSDKGIKTRETKKVKSYGRRILEWERNDVRERMEDVAATLL
jgi:hypothetical protein